jgi:uncharacterized pyridoxal phosphate-containing UPF0001 family protein
MTVLNNYNLILNSLKLYQRKIDLVVVTKNQTVSKINLLINKNHLHFGKFIKDNFVLDFIIKLQNFLIKSLPQEGFNLK